MNRHAASAWWIVTAFALPVVLGLVAPARAADPTGAWKCTAVSNWKPAGSNASPFELKLKGEGSRLTGVYVVSQIETPVEDGKIEGDAVSFATTRMVREPTTVIAFKKVVISFKGTLRGDTIKGAWVSALGDVDFGDWEAKRAGPTATNRPADTAVSVRTMLAAGRAWEGEGTFEVTDHGAKFDDRGYTTKKSQVKTTVTCEVLSADADRWVLRVTLRLEDGTVEQEIVRCQDISPYGGVQNFEKKDDPAFKVYGVGPAIGAPEKLHLMISRTFSSKVRNFFGLGYSFGQAGVDLKPRAK